MSIEKLKIDDARAIELMPLWLAEEAVYANAKFRSMGRICTQESVFRGGLQPGGSAYQDFANYARFKNFLDPDIHGSRTVLRASSYLGKFAGVSRALASMLYMRDWDLPTLDAADDITLGRLDDRLSRLNTCTYELADMNRDNFDDFFNESVEQPLAEVAAAVETTDTQGLLELVEPMLDDHAMLFASFTKHHGLIAQPGVSSGRQAIEWCIPALSSPTDTATLSGNGL